MGISFGGDLSSTGVTLKAIDDQTMRVVNTYKADLDDIARSVGVTTTVNGMIEGPEDGEFSVPGEVLVAGIEDVMKQAAADSRYKNSDVRKGSWSVQGHLQAYLRKQIVNILQDPSSAHPLWKQVKDMFTCNCPTWRDSTTTLQVEQLNQLMSQAGLNVITMAERYPGPQIKKRVGTDAYNNADLITIGNALASFIITGIPTFSGPGDAAASGFVDLETLTLDRKAMNIIDPGLHQKIAPVTPAGGCIGDASSYYKAMGYINLKMFVGDQDNVKSAAYLISSPTVLQVSLGTSYTVSIIAKQPIPGFEGNFATNDSKYPYLLLLCKNNGSSSISEVLQEYNLDENDFAKITTALRATPIGNDGAMALPHFGPEIVPYNPGGKGIIRKDYDEKSATLEKDMRAVIEGNAASMSRYASEYFGQTVGGKFTALSFAGGATNNRDLVQVWLDMFGLPGYFMKHADDAAAIGAGLTAIADSDNRRTLQTVLSAFLKANTPTVLNPDNSAKTFYNGGWKAQHAQFEDAYAQKRK